MENETKEFKPVIKTVSDLKRYVEAAGHETHFFTRSSMKFFGDRMSNYGVRLTKIVTWSDPEPVEVYELYRRKAVKHGLDSSSYFDAKTFERRHEKK